VRHVVGDDEDANYSIVNNLSVMCHIIDSSAQR
jgi:hypothetical protein